VAGPDADREVRDLPLFTSFEPDPDLTEMSEKTLPSEFGHCRVALQHGSSPRATCRTTITTIFQAEPA
jgi:hypothetical protein